MSANFDGNLTYRDYVVHIFSGILLNMFLLAALYTPGTILPNSLYEIIQKLDFSGEIILSLMAIPILFLEGHFLLAIDRFLFVELPTWYLDRKRNKYSKPDNHETAVYSYYTVRKQLYIKSKLLFYLLFTKRIVGQRIIKEVKGNCKLVKSQKDSGLSRRYYVLSDFFKGCGLAAWIALFVAFANHNWWCVATLGAVIVLAWLRCRFYSRLYVKEKYKKKE
jgi:hypothetical protein